jgi:AraC family transcriptional regulator
MPVNERATQLDFAAARAVHITMPPHEVGGYTSTTEPFTIGISFTGHANTVIDDGTGHSAQRSFGPGTCAINGPTAIKWLRVAEQSEALEIQPSVRVRASVAEELGADWQHYTGFLQTEYDAIIWAVCARYRMAALGAATLTAPEVDALVHNLLAHVAVRYLGARAPKRVRGRLDARRLTRVIALIDSSLHDPPSLRDMADAAAMSPFHFQRLFRATTGLTPHAYVTARRMERARRMLIGSHAKVAYVAAELGFSDLAHFRRTFRRQFNGTPRS